MNTDANANKQMQRKMRMSKALLIKLKNFSIVFIKPNLYDLRF